MRAQSRASHSYAGTGTLDSNSLWFGIVDEDILQGAQWAASIMEYYDNSDAVRNNNMVPTMLYWG